MQCLHRVRRRGGGGGRSGEDKKSALPPGGGGGGGGGNLFLEESGGAVGRAVRMDIFLWEKGLKKKKPNSVSDLRRFARRKITN